jgi:hypothetical protein
MSGDRLGNLFARFMRSVAMLAAPARTQARWLNSLGLGEAALSDELALEFEDGFLLLGQFVDAGWLAQEAAEVLQRIGDRLEAMSGQDNAAMWDVVALESAPDWNELRDLAGEFFLKV